MQERFCDVVTAQVTLNYTFDFDARLINIRLSDCQLLTQSLTVSLFNAVAIMNHMVLHIN